MRSAVKSRLGKMIRRTLETPQFTTVETRVTVILLSRYRVWGSSNRGANLKLLRRILKWEGIRKEWRRICYRRIRDWMPGLNINQKNYSRIDKAKHSPIKTLSGSQFSGLSHLPLCSRVQRILWSTTDPWDQWCRTWMVRRFSKKKIKIKATNPNLTKLHWPSATPCLKSKAPTNQTTLEPVF